MFTLRGVTVSILLLLSGCNATHPPAPITDLSPNADARQHRNNAQFDLSEQQAHRVLAGETLYSIAWQANLDFRDLARYNSINPPYNILIGQSLRLKAPTRSAGQPSKPAEKPVPKVVKTVNNQTFKKSEKIVNKVLPQTLDEGVTQAYRESQGKPKKSVITKTNSFPSRVSQWLWPHKGRLIGRFSTSGTPNKGIDIAGKSGDTIKATAAGKVVYTGNALKGYGNLIIIKHTNNFLSAYAHNERIHVMEQQWIKPGEKIGTIGRMGSKGHALHFEIRYKGKAVDPLNYLK